MYFKHATLIVATLIASSASAQSWGVWQPDPSLPTNGIAKTHAIGLEHNGMIFILGGPPWMNPPTEDPTVYSMPIGGTSWTEEIGFDGYGGVLGQGGGVDNMGRIIIFGGDDINDPGGFDKLPFEWNPDEGPWHDHAARGGSAPATNFAYCTDESNRIYSLGGGPGETASFNNPNSSYCERFIGSTDLWEPIAPMPIATAGAAASPDGMGGILVFGGIAPDGSARINEVQRYDIATNTWSTNLNTNMPAALSGHQATLGADGRVYILGGTSGFIGSGQVEQRVHVYDPNTDQWADGPDMSEPRRFFASFLGSDDRVYIAGGDNNFGGSFGVESIYTTPCPEFVLQPVAAALWLHASISLHAQTIGGGAISYQWTRDGIPLSNGASAGGGVISGAQSASLLIESSGDLDAGQYALIASNACGDVSSFAVSISIQTPPTVPENWTWTSLHPLYATSSSANGVDNGVQVGTAVFDTPDYNNIDHPMRWEGTVESGVNLTAPGSQGGSISDIDGDRLIGWWWKPIQCYVNHQWQTCHYRRGAWWNLDGTFHETNYSGFEYTRMSATDGISVVGTGTTDDASGNVYSKAVIWQGTDHQNALSLHPTGFRNSFANATDGANQYGAATLAFQGIHAAKWSGSSVSFVDMHPAGAINSTITAAGDGQQVGIINQWNNPHAVLWANTPESVVDLNPDGATESNVNDCQGGLQIGSVAFPDGGVFHPGIWSGHRDTFHDLIGIIPDGYTGLALNAIDISLDGTISIAGSAWNIDASRREAIVIVSTSVAICHADLNGDGNLDFLDISAFLAAFGDSDPIADLNADGNYDFLDISVFLSEFTDGCP